MEDTNAQRTRVESQSGGCVTARAAAAMLERAARLHGSALSREDGDGRSRLYVDSVGELAGDIGRDLAALSERPEVSAAALVSAALRGADLATLAACALPELPPGSPAYLRVEASARLAAAATRSLSLEHAALDPSGAAGAAGGYEARDLRGAEWRADLATRQVDEMRQESL